MAALKRCDRCETLLDADEAHGVLLSSAEGDDLVDQDLCADCSKEVQEFLENE